MTVAPSGLYDPPNPTVWQEIRAQSEVVTARITPQTIEARIVRTFDLLGAFLAAEREVRAIDDEWRTVELARPIGPPSPGVARGTPDLTEDEVTSLQRRDAAAVKARAEALEALLKERA